MVETFWFEVKLYWTDDLFNIRHADSFSLNFWKLHDEQISSNVFSKYLPKLFLLNSYVTENRFKEFIIVADIYEGNKNS